MADRMADYPANPHDGLVKALLESPERAAVVLRENLPTQVTDKLTEDIPEHLPGSYVDPNLQETHSDRLFQARLHDGRTLYIYVLIEHKSEKATVVMLWSIHDRKGRRSWL